MPGPLHGVTLAQTGVHGRVFQMGAGIGRVSVSSDYCNKSYSPGAPATHIESPQLLRLGNRHPGGKLEPGEGPVLVHRCHSARLHVERASELSEVPSYQGTNPLVQAPPLGPNQLPRVLPTRTVTLGVRFQLMNFSP